MLRYFLLGLVVKTITLIKNRLKRFAIEIEFKDNFKFQMINENLDETVGEIEKIIQENIK